jgi:hypothetical protein
MLPRWHASRSTTVYNTRCPTRATGGGAGVQGNQVTSGRVSARKLQQQRCSAAYDTHTLLHPTGTSQGLAGAVAHARPGSWQQPWYIWRRCAVVTRAQVGGAASTAPVQ